MNTGRKCTSVFGGRVIVWITFPLRQSNFQWSIMTSCVVCFKQINRFPGLYNSCCGIWLCETCKYNVLSEHCPICDRGVLNVEHPCHSCLAPTKMFQSRECKTCSQSCCIQCSTSSNCCVSGLSTICTHVFCQDCWWCLKQCVC